MQYGHFQDDAREYVITNPCTPVKWINYLGTLEFGGFVDHTGGALICRARGTGSGPCVGSGGPSMMSW
jgi:cellobiose phosphorylase